MGPHFPIIQGRTGFTESLHLKSLSIIITLMKVFSSTFKKLSSLTFLLVSIWLPFTDSFAGAFVLLGVYESLEPGNIYLWEFTPLFPIGNAATTQKLCFWVINFVLTWEPWQRCSFHWVYPTQDLLNFLNAYIVFLIFQKFKAMFLQIFFLFLSVLSWDSHCTYVGAQWESHFYFILFYLVYFLFLRLKYFNWPISKFTDSFISQFNFYPFCLSSEFFISVILFQSLNFYLVPYYNFYLFINVLHLGRYCSYTFL